MSCYHDRSLCVWIRVSTPGWVRGGCENYRRNDWSVVGKSNTDYGKHMFHYTKNPGLERVFDYKCIDIRNTYNNFFDVDKIVTNVTIKDAPYEFDLFLTGYLRQYGEVVEHSTKRGKVKVPT